MLQTEYENRMKALLGDGYADYLRAMSSQPEKAIRINTNKISNADFVGAFPFATENVPFDENALYVNVGTEDKLGNLPLHFAGGFYVQEPSAMTPVASLPIKKDMRVLDMCAAPGGKSIQALSRLVGTGYLVANEISPSRCAVLMGNIERMGYKNAIVTNLDSDAVASVYAGAFDAVICDAPCSGEGMMRKLDIARNEWSVQNVVKCAERQAQILDNAARCVAPGGYLLYSTCTFSTEEDECIVSDFLSRHPDFELIDAPDEVKAQTVCGIGMEKARRFYPHTGRGEGQFLSVMRRTSSSFADSEITQKPDRYPADELRVINVFLTETIGYIPDGALIKHGDTYSLMPSGAILPPHSVYAAGVKIGQVQKGRIVPHHQYFSAFGAEFKNRIDLHSSDNDAAKYIGGNVIDAHGAAVGWAAVTIDGCAIGGAKVSDGQAKNHFPKGLRKTI
ncbi:MAG: methyltransferase domain-containing protein [Clostridia bacterium]|nr:methyltransferase domain-containing protein [Clostridia bacterium]